MSIPTIEQLITEAQEKLHEAVELARNATTSLQEGEMRVGVSFMTEMEITPVPVVELVTPGVYVTKGGYRYVDVLMQDQVTGLIMFEVVGEDVPRRSEMMTPGIFSLLFERYTPKLI